ncbi:hypothetical protein ACF0H5_004251 [Mactra antiquata]
MSNKVTPIQVEPAKSCTDLNANDFEGPTNDRQCRDIIFLLIFIVFMGGMGAVSWRAIVLGNPYRIIYGTDSYGNICSQKNAIIDGVDKNLTGLDLSDKSYLFYFDENIFDVIVDSASGQTDSMKICVSSCPDSDISTVSQLKSFATVKGSELCTYDINPTEYFDGTNGQIGCPALPIHEHDDFLYRCIPTSISKRINHVLSALNSLMNAIDENLFEKGANDIVNTWVEMSILCGLAIVISIILTLLLKFLAAFIVWFMVFAMVVGTLAATGLCWYHYHEVKADMEAIVSEDRTPQMKKKTRDWLIGSICVTVITVIVILVILALRKHIKLVVELFREAGKAIKCMPMLLILPGCTVVCLATVFLSLAWIFLYIETAGLHELQPNNGTVTFQPDDILKVLKWYYIFGIIWCIQIVLACHKMTIAGAVSVWYFTRNKSSISLPVLKSIWRIIRYHIGSIIFGCLILTIVMFIRLLLSFVENRLRGKEHPIAVFLFKCFKCCLWCFEKFIKFLNSNAYIEIAIYGYGFCEAAREAFQVIIKNALRLAAINSVGDFVLFLGKVATIAIVTVVGIEWISLRKSINYVWLPVSIVGIFTYFISSCFMSVYEMTIDTLFICFCEDSIINDGENRPYFMSTGLRECMSANLKKKRPTSGQKKDLKI